MSDKFTARQRRSRKLRSKTKEMSNHRLSIFRSNNQIYAQVFSPDGKEVLAHASSADKEAKLDKGGNQEAAKKVGELMGDILNKNNIKEAVFDRGGYIYHGRVKALADGIREKGIKF